MFRRCALLVILAAVAGIAAYVWLTIPVIRSAAALPPHLANLTNGEATFYAGGCSSCHAVPKQDDPTRLGGGLAIASPFGTFYVPNISPDPVDGIGRWTEAEFVTAVTEGTSPAGTHYFPAFPYVAYHGAKVSDVRDLFAYLKTLPPVSGKVRDHEVPFPFNIRRNIGIWKWLFMRGDAFTPDPARPEPWNRGAYLVNSLGHCAECHSPRNWLGGIKVAKRFAGGPNPEGEGWVPNITQKGLADWSESDFADFLKTGDLPNGDRTSGAMVRVIRNTSRLSDADRAAMAAYLKSLPPVEGPARPLIVSK